MLCMYQNNKNKEHGEQNNSVICQTHVKTKDNLEHIEDYAARDAYDCESFCVPKGRGNIQ